MARINRIAVPRKPHARLSASTPHVHTNNPLKTNRFSFAGQNALILGFLSVALLSWAGSSRAQKVAPPASTTPMIHYDFPFQTMWDDAVIRSARTRKPVIVFDLDLIDSNSINLAQKVITSKDLQSYLRNHFEAAMNDFAVDPPMSVGLDSLRNLGWRLSGLEKDYEIAVRPCIILISPDKEEMDRIVFPQLYTAAVLEKRIKDILAGKNTLKSTIADFWKDTTSIPKRQYLINMFEERSKYDSVVRHLEVLCADKAHPKVARDAWIRYSDLRLRIEGNLAPLNQFAATLGKHGADSVLGYELLHKTLEFYIARKMHDSVSSTYERIMVYTGQRDPDLLNEYAWHIANYVKDAGPALPLIEEAISKRPTDPNLYDTRARINARLKHIDDAIRDEEKALSLSKTAEDKTYFATELVKYRQSKANPPAESSPKQDDK